jgi:hypothetical protein
MGIFVGYEPAARCSSEPTVGAKALMAAFLGLYQARGGTNLGIFNCRTVRGGTTTSLHGEGRACDLGVKPHGAQWGTQLADRLRMNSAELGVQCVIWDRRIWSGSYPQAGWRPYRGVNPHVDHLHVELSRHAAQTLTAAKAHAVLFPSAGVTPSPAPRDEEDDLRDDERLWLQTIYDQITGNNFEGWPTWKGGTGEKLSLIDYARRDNVETRQLHHNLNAVHQKLDTLGARLGDLRGGTIDPEPIVAAIVDAGIAEQVVEALAARLSRTD